MILVIINIWQFDMYLKDKSTKNSSIQETWITLGEFILLKCFCFCVIVLQSHPQLGVEKMLMLTLS